MNEVREVTPCVCHLPVNDVGDDRNCQPSLQAVEQSKFTEETIFIGTISDLVEAPLLQLLAI